MKDLEQIFFELIRVAIGTQSCFTRTPSASEWKKLYVMAKKQSLVGVCFAGVQKLRKADEANGTRVTENLPEMGYVKWMGMAAKIQRKNEKVNRQCVELQDMLVDKRYKSCILKGQGVGALYKVSGERLEVSGDGLEVREERSLADLRQSGDIDVWIEGGVEAAVRLAESLGQKANVTEQHIRMDLFESSRPEESTEVEVHFIPSMLKNPLADWRLQQWFKKQAGACFENKVSLKGIDGKDGNSICVPTVEFNIVYILIHIYRHLFSEGVGMRQVMDYYFVLQADGKDGREDALKTIQQLGLMKFAGALMYVMQEVFGMKRQMMICEPNEKHGRFLLNEIMLAGNMGTHDERLKDALRGTRWQRFCMVTKHNMRLLGYYPLETLWGPFSRISIWAWRKWNGWI